MGTDPRGQTFIHIYGREVQDGGLASSPSCSPLSSGLHHLNHEAQESPFRGAIGHAGKAMRSSPRLTPPTYAGQGALPTELTSVNTEHAAYILEKGARSHSPGAALAHLRTPAVKCARPLTHLTVGLNLSGPLPAKELRMVSCSQPNNQLQ